MEPFTYCKLEILIPETHLKALQKVLQGVDAGHIGKYDSCISHSLVTGCWRPLEGSSPFIGKCGTISMELELKAEVTCRMERLEETLAAIRKAHPYEEPVINVIPLYATGMDIVPWYRSYSDSPHCPTNRTSVSETGGTWVCNNL